MVRYLLLVVLLIDVSYQAALGQDEAVPDTVMLVRVGDSLRVVSDTMTFFHPGAVITGATAAQNRSASTLQRLKIADIERSDATNVADIARLIPSAHVQTNSRGETLLYLRNSGERQLAVYFDGALLNIPWDNRVDLDLIPAAAIAEATVSKGASSSEFGSNLMGGVVNLISRDLGSVGNFTEVSTHLGSGGERQFEMTHLGRLPSFSYLASVGYLDRDGLVLASDSDLPFSQTDPDLRTNTDLQRTNGLARAEYSFDSGVSMSLAGLIIDAEKGIAPEGHKDPAEASVRFWRYPEWQNKMLIAQVGRPADRSRIISFQASTWLNEFDQEIEAFKSDQYSVKTDDQVDRDMTVGGRIVVAADYDQLGVRWAGNVSHSTHDQSESEFDELGSVAVSVDEMRYQQVLSSSGVEADFRVGPMTYSAGLNMDVRNVVDAHVFETPDAQVDLGARVGLIRDLEGPLELRASIGRRSRFPTLREQFSGALGRFVLNPDLGSEEAILAETSIKYDADALAFDVTGFLTATTDAIDQVVVIQDGKSRRMRVNLDGTRNVGVELSGSYRPVNRVTVTADLTLSRLRAKNSDTGEFNQKLTERPEHTAAVRTDYRHVSGASGTIEIAYTGTAYSLDEAGDHVELDASTVVNVRAAYHLNLGDASGIVGELIARVDNVADTVVENQLGLPGPGRMAKVGLKLTI